MYTFTGFVLQLSLLAVGIVANPPRAPLHREHGSLIHRQTTLNSSQLLPIPTKDAWFDPADDWQSKAPGAVLKLRKSAYPNITISNCIDTFQVQYRTTDSNNNASYAVTTVFIPASQANCSTSNQTACSHGIITYQVPYDSADPNATPSYLLQFGDPYGEVTDLLAHGWFVSAPDYEGPQSSYCAGVQSGHATLDAVRATNQVLDQFGFRTDIGRNALWGYSGGAMATEFAAELQGQYAPELAIAGIVAGGLAPNLTTVGRLMNAQDTAGLLIASINGITTQHSEARDYMMKQLKTEGPYNATGFLAAKQMSGVTVLYAYMYEDVYKYFINGSADVYSPVMMEMYNKDGVMGIHGTPVAPMFIYKAIQDEMSPANETDAIIDRYCSDGANILYHRNSLGGHNQELWAGRARVMDYLGAVLNGANTTLVTIPTKGCSTVNVTIGTPGEIPNKMVRLAPADRAHRLDIFGRPEAPKRRRWW